MYIQFSYTKCLCKYVYVYILVCTHTLCVYMYMYIYKYIFTPIWERQLNTRTTYLQVSVAITGGAEEATVRDSRHARKDGARPLGERHGACRSSSLVHCTSSKHRLWSGNDVLLKNPVFAVPAAQVKLSGTKCCYRCDSLLLSAQTCGCTSIRRPPRVTTAVQHTRTAGQAAPHMT